MNGNRTTFFEAPSMSRIVSSYSGNPSTVVTNMSFGPVVISMSCSWL